MSYFLPSRAEWSTIFDNLSKKEKILFIVFFLAAWITGALILIKIDKNYSAVMPAAGGSIIEGVVGSPRFINPLLTASDADRDLTRVLYAGLLRSDGRGNLVHDLADRYEISDDGLTYSFYLRDNLKWHDGQNLTASDVAFTINLAKNPAIHSAKLANWEGVSIEIVDDRTIKFHLRKPYAPFLANTTLGIMPKHVWEKIPPDEFNTSTYNTNPVGSGPFAIDSIQKQSTSGSITSYTLKRFAYYQPKPAYLETMTFHFYTSEDALNKDLKEGTVELANVPQEETLPEHSVLRIHLPRVFTLFLNQDSIEAFRDQGMRDALTLATDRNRILNEAFGGSGNITSLPIPPGSFGYASDLEATTIDIQKAKDALKAAHYEDSDGDGIIERVVKKEHIPVRFRIATLNESPELIKTAELISAMWREIGVDATVDKLDRSDLDKMINERKYDVLLYGQLLGFEPDPFAFWHTSQRKPPAGLNIANYANTKVDKLLEDARTTIDQDKRASLYRSFQQELIKDKPAIFLLSQAYLYAVPSRLHGIDIQAVASPEERFSTVASWYTDTRTVWNFLVRK